MDGTWKLAKDGRIATGWQTWENNLYYLNSDGSMKANEPLLTAESSISSAAGAVLIRTAGILPMERNIICMITAQLPERVAESRWKMVLFPE